MNKPMLRLLASMCLLSVVSTPVFGETTVPIEKAGMEWQLLSRTVACVQTPARVGTGFLIANEYLVTSATVVGGEPFERIRVAFGNPPRGEDSPDALSAIFTDDVWRVLSVAIVPLDGCSNAAVLRLAPKAGMYAGELYGHLGARPGDPLSGEPGHVLAVAADGSKSYTYAGALLDAESGVCHTGGPLCFAYESDSPESGDGAPVLDDGGCLIGMQCASGLRQALAININHLRRMMPDNGCPLETCMLGVEYEYQFDSISGTLKTVGGAAAALPREDEPRIVQYSPPGGGGSSLGGSSGYVPPEFDYPDHPPGYRELPPPVSPDDPEPSPDPHHPHRPTPPSDPNNPVPEPGTMLLLLGAAVMGGSCLRRRG